MAPVRGAFPGEGAGWGKRTGAGLLLVSEDYRKSLPETVAATLLTVSSPAPKHDPGLRREGLVRGRNMPAQIARTGVLSGRSKRKRRRAAGDLGQDPGEMVTAGVHLALVRLGLDGCCRGWEQQEHTMQGAFMARWRGLKVFSSEVGGEKSWKCRGAQGSCGQQKRSLWLDWETDSPSDFSCTDGGPRSAGWREHGDRRRKFDFDLRGDRGGCGEEEGRGGGSSSHLRRCRAPDGFDDDKDGLPEWCLDDEDEEMGTFDASGAFLPLKVSMRRPGEDFY